MSAFYSAKRVENHMRRLFGGFAAKKSDAVSGASPIKSLLFINTMNIVCADKPHLKKFPRRAVAHRGKTLTPLLR